MDQKELREWEARCIQDEPPLCRAGCPLNVDARAFVSRIAAGNVAAARKILEKHIPLTGIVARLCEAPCQDHCLRRDLGGSVSIGLLERFCVENTPSSSRFLPLPARPGNVGILGSGPSSLVAAFDLAKKGYPVFLYHRGVKPDSLLQRLGKEQLPETVFDEEMRRLQELKVVFISAEHLDENLIITADHDAYYIGQDDLIAEALVKEVARPDPDTRAVDRKGWFSGGTADDTDPHCCIRNFSQGREAAVSLDRYLQGASLTASRTWLRNGRTALVTNVEGVKPVPAIVPKMHVYSPEEAAEEAGRCLDCQCLECVKNCVYLAEFGDYPKAYVRRIYNNSAIVKGIHQANRLINSCALCRQCEKLCPQGFSMTDLCLETRRLMVREKRMPPSAHWFALEEMRFAGSEGAFVNHAPGKSGSKALFFPGCQLVGTRPVQTKRLYRCLKELEPDTGIWLDCCGAPAYWAGREEESAEWCRRLERCWHEMGQPEIIMACSSCLQVFRQYLPEINVRPVWNVLLGYTFRQVEEKTVMALSDPCTARDDNCTREDVRRLLDAIGQPLVPLKMSGEITECCGFGGLVEAAHPDLAAKMAANRAGQSEEVILTYCVMCREQLARSGAPVVYMLDILFPEISRGPWSPPVSLSDRRVNRREIKEEIMQEYPDSQKPEPREWERIELILPEAAQELTEKRRILTDDIKQVLFEAEKKGTVFIREGQRTSVATARLGPVTFWVQFSRSDDSYLVERCWSHRMEILGGVP